MEFEILNEIMTSTVAQLFTINRQSHLKFFKNSSQLNESKIDIPLNRAASNSALNDTNNNGGHSERSNAGSGYGSGGTSEAWVLTHGKKFLEDARERLQIGPDPK
jgi:hypothetical protein